MDPTRFDALSRSFAERSTRRATIRGLGAGGLAAGLLASLGLRPDAARAAQGDVTCLLSFVGTVAAGVDDKTELPGTLSLTIGADGVIDAGTLKIDQGDQFPLVGQAVGRALSLRVDIGGGQVMTLAGIGENAIAKCAGRIDGTFGGPDVTDLGTWTATRKKGLGGGTTGGTKPAPTPAGGTSGGGTKPTPTPAGGTSSGGGNANCASGVVCGGTCCTSRAGYTPDQMYCDGDMCQCRYSCAAAGCQYGGTDHFVSSFSCDDRPDARCGEDCNFSPDNGCGGMTCASGTTLDVDSCTCLPDSGGGACTGTMVPCGGKCVPACEFGGTLDPTTCQCVAPSGGGSVSCDGGASNCAGFSPYVPNSISCQGSNCVCSYSCQAAGCPNADPNTYMGIACTNNPNSLCANFGCG